MTSVTTTLKFFEYEHLPEHLRDVSKQVADVAHWMESALEAGPEKSAGMRKLLEAKDCFVRARLMKGG